MNKIALPVALIGLVLAAGGAFMHDPWTVAWGAVWLSAASFLKE